MRPGMSCDTISMLKTWSKISIFALPRDGLGLPSPKMYEFSDLLKLCKLPPKLTKVCCPMQLRWVPVLIKKVELPGPVMWKLTVVKPDLLFEWPLLQQEWVGATTLGPGQVWRLVLPSGVPGPTIWPFPRVILRVIIHRVIYYTLFLSPYPNRPMCWSMLS